jgi:AcrR family transcriptional regulator
MRTVTRLATEGATERAQAERAGFAAFFDFVDQHRQLYRVVRQAEFVDAELFREYYRQFAEGYCAGLSAAMERGEIDRMDPEVLAYCLMGIGDFIGMRWVVWSSESIRAEVFEDVMRFIKRGLSRREEPGTEGGRTERD